MRNNGARRKAWRKEAADFNKGWWELRDPERLVSRLGYFAKPYVRTDREPRPH